jgi:hypothetical protein
MSRDEAVQWLHEVDGELYRTPRSRAEAAAWVAVVRTPRSGARPPGLIIALGQTLQEAASAAASQWHAVWRTLSGVH